MISGIAAIAAEAPNLATAPFMTAAIVGGQAARYQTLWINRLRRPGFLTGPTTERDERPAHGRQRLPPADQGADALCSP
jgi:hypothetical protein